MGWKGTLRSMNAAANRQARLSEKRQRYQEKQEAQEAAYNVVTQQENFLDALVSLHEECNACLDWSVIQAEASPVEPKAVTSRTDIVQKKIDNFKLLFFDKALKTAIWRRNRLDKKLVRAKEKDKKEYEAIFNHFQEEKNVWNKRQMFVSRIKNNDYSVYAEIIEEYGELSEIPLGKDLGFMISDKGELVFDLKVMPQEDIIPNEEYSLRQSGTLSTKKMAKTKGVDIYQDHVCSCLIRVAREVFGLLPISNVQANAVLNALNPQTGHLEDQVIVSADIKRETLEGLNFKGIDPSDSFKNFVHNMKFTKSRGFEAVERVNSP